MTFINIVIRCSYFQNRKRKKKGRIDRSKKMRQWLLGKHSKRFHRLWFYGTNYSDYLQLLSRFQKKNEYIHTKCILSSRNEAQKTQPGPKNWTQRDWDIQDWKISSLKKLCGISDIYFHLSFIFIVFYLVLLNPFHDLPNLWWTMTLTEI